MVTLASTKTSPFSLTAIKSDNWSLTKGINLNCSHELQVKQVWTDDHKLKRMTNIVSNKVEQIFKNNDIQKVHLRLLTFNTYSKSSLSLQFTLQLSIHLSALVLLIK